MTRFVRCDLSSRPTGVSITVGNVRPVIRSPTAPPWRASAAPGRESGGIKLFVASPKQRDLKRARVMAIRENQTLLRSNACSDREMLSVMWPYGVDDRAEKLASVDSADPPRDFIVPNQVTDARLENREAKRSTSRWRDDTSIASATRSRGTATSADAVRNRPRRRPPHERFPRNVSGWDRVQRLLEAPPEHRLVYGARSPYASFASSSRPHRTKAGAEIASPFTPKPPEWLTS